MQITGQVQRVRFTLTSKMHACPVFFFLTVEFFGFYEKVSVLIVTSAIYGSLKPFFSPAFCFSSAFVVLIYNMAHHSIILYFYFECFFEYITHVCYSSSCTMLFSDKPNLFCVSAMCFKCCPLFASLVLNPATVQ